MQIPVAVSQVGPGPPAQPFSGLCPRKGLQAHGLCRALTLHSDTWAGEFLVVGACPGAPSTYCVLWGTGWVGSPALSQCHIPTRLPPLWGLQDRVFLYPQPTLPTGAALTSRPVLQDLVWSSILISVNANDI